MPEDNLTKDDLMLLMESYRNMIEYHQTILEQSTKTIEKLDSITTKQDIISTKQNSTCIHLKSITNKLDSVIGSSADHHKELHDHNIESIKTHGKLANKIHVGWVGMGSIIVGIIAIVVALITQLPIIP
jgi:hypothetical protein